MYPYRSKLTPRERFDATVIYDPDCWLWPTPPTTGRKYPTVNWYGQRISVNRVAWAVATGSPPPPDLCVCHTCDNRLCVRNDEQGTYEVRGVLLPRWGHLFLGTIAQNSADMVDKGRSLIGERNIHQRITTAIAQAIKADRQAGLTIPQLVTKYGQPRGTIVGIVCHVTWRHLL